MLHVTVLAKAGPMDHWTFPTTAATELWVCCQRELADNGKTQLMNFTIRDRQMKHHVMLQDKTKNANMRGPIHQKHKQQIPYKLYATWTTILNATAWTKQDPEINELFPPQRQRKFEFDVKKELADNGKNTNHEFHKERSVKRNTMLQDETTNPNMREPIHTNNEFH